MSASVTPTGRVNFPQVFEPKSIGGSDPKFTMTLIFEPDDAGLAPLKELAAKAAKSKWGADLPENLQSPFIDGSDTDLSEQQGKVLIRFKANEDRPPKVYDQFKNIISLPGDFYSGCYARVVTNAYAWEYMGKKGVSFGLGDIQKVREGERLDGGLSGAEAFDVVESDQAAPEAPASNNPF